MYDTESWAPRSQSAQYATGEEWRTNTNSPRKNEVAGPKWKQCSDMDVSDVKVKSNFVKNNTA